MPAGTLHLIDASPYIFRAYFSLPPTLVSPAGAPVAAVYGFASFLLRLAEGERPTHLGIAFDRSLTTSFRNELYPAYKAQRELPPAALEAQLEACYELAEAFGAAVLIDDRYEADDLIGTLVRRAAESAGKAAGAGWNVVVVTSDKDLAQLVSERVSLYDFAAGSRLGPAEVEAKFGVPPAKIADLLGLAGDAVDNIPGVPGIGAKTAAALLAHFGDLPELFERLGEVAALPIRGARSVAAKLEAGRDIALLSRRLATVACDVPLALGVEDLAWRGPDPAQVEALCERLGFGGLKERLLKLAP